MAKIITPTEIKELFYAWGGLIPQFGIAIDDGDPNIACTMLVDAAKCSAPHLAHGGAIMALMDTALGMLALKTSLEVGLASSTVEMKVNFLSPARLGETLRTSSSIVSKGKSLLVIQGTASETTSGREVAFAVGTFNMYSVKNSQELKGYLSSD